MGSLRRHLLAWILGALSAGGLALVGVSYLVTLEEMDEIFDENLKQVALAVASHHRFAAGSAPQRRAMRCRRCRASTSSRTTSTSSR